MIVPGVEAIEINLDEKQLLVIRGNVTEYDVDRISEQIGVWLKSDDPLLVLAVDTGTSVELVKISGAEKAQEQKTLLADAIGIIADLVAASVANPDPKHESFDWAWNELTDSAQEQVKDAYRKAVDWLEIVSPSKATDVQEKYPLNPDGSIPGIPKPDAALDAFCVPLCKHDGLLYGLVADGKVVEPCPICGKNSTEEGWRPPW